MLKIIAAFYIQKSNPDLYSCHCWRSKRFPFCNGFHTKHNKNETGWDLGPSAAGLPCLHLDNRLLEQQDTKKLYGTKNNCVHVQLGQILDKRYKRPKKAQLPLLKSQQQKAGHCTCPLHSAPPKG